MKWAWLVGAALVSMVVCGVAIAQEAPVRIVQGSDGTLYLLKSGARYVIAADAIGDDELAAYADGGALAGGDVVAALGASTDASAVSRSAPAAPPADAAPVAPDSGDQAQVTPAATGAAKTRASDAGQTPQTNQQTTAPIAGRPGVSVLNFVKIQGAAPGGTASVSVQSMPGITCSIVYRTPADAVSTAAGLGSKTTDGAGVVTWSWTIDPNTRIGLGRLIVTCGNNQITDIVQIVSTSTGPTK